MGMALQHTDVNGGIFMEMKDILDFVKIEHTLFSLPFVLMGFVLADRQFGTESTDLLWIIVAAIGARGLAMALNRVVDKEIDANNPRTASRHYLLAR